MKNQLSNVDAGAARPDRRDRSRRGPTAAAPPLAPRRPVIPAVINRKVQSLDARRPAAAEARPHACGQRRRKSTAAATSRRTGEVRHRRAALAAPASRSGSRATCRAGRCNRDAGKPRCPSRLNRRCHAPADASRRLPKPAGPPAPADASAAEIAATGQAHRRRACLPGPRCRTSAVPGPAGDSNRAPRTLRPGGNRPVLRQTGSPGAGPRPCGPRKPPEPKKPVEKIHAAARSPSPRSTWRRSATARCGPKMSCVPAAPPAMPPVIEDDDDDDAKKKGGKQRPARQRQRPRATPGRTQQARRGAQGPQPGSRSRNWPAASPTSTCSNARAPAASSTSSKRSKPTEPRKGKVPIDAADHRPLALRSDRHAGRRPAVQARSDPRPGHAHDQHQLDARARPGRAVRPGTRLRAGDQDGRSTPRK